MPEGNFQIGKIQCVKSQKRKERREQAKQRKAQAKNPDTHAFQTEAGQDTETPPDTINP